MLFLVSVHYHADFPRYSTGLPVRKGNEGERETGNDVGDGLMIDAKWLTLDKESSNEERSGYIKNTDNLSVYFFGCFLVCIFIIILDLKSPRPVRNIRSTLCQLNTRSRPSHPSDLTKPLR